ncbi:unnamed protein product [Arabidopsis lyrata]|nr:unnamed protein product [Arabidopsis lyrata]
MTKKEIKLRIKMSTDKKSLSKRTKTEKLATEEDETLKRFCKIWSKVLQTRTELKVRVSAMEGEKRLNCSRIRIEAEESLSAWNGKNLCSVSCIKRVGESEKNSLVDENNRLLEAFVADENLSKKAKEENRNNVRNISNMRLIIEANVGVDGKSEG